MRNVMPFGCLALIVFGGILLMPFLFSNALLAALNKLGLSPGMAVLAALGIFVGGLFNVPVRKLEREDQVEVISPSIFGLQRFQSPWIRKQNITITLNVGGAIIPLILVVHECLRLIGRGNQVILASLVAVALNIVVCFFLARPVPGIGITLSPFIPAFLAALSAWILVPEFAPPVAFIAGVLGPVIGADLLHLDDVRGTRVNMISIGGAGTFDGIVLSGLVATLLA